MIVPLLPRTITPLLSVSSAPVVGNACWVDAELTGGVSRGVTSDADVFALVMESEELGMDCPAPREVSVCRGVIWLFPLLDELGRGICELVIEELAAAEDEAAAAVELEVEGRAPDPEALGVPEAFTAEPEPGRTLDPLPVLP